MSQERLWEIVAPTVEGMGYELVGIERTRNGRRAVLRVYIDTPAGVTLADCEAVSRQLDAVLDVEAPLRGPYDLEVSSPGADRPLFKAEDYRRFAGERVRIRLSAAEAGRRQYTGTLLGLHEGRVRIEVDGETVELALDRIERGRLVPRW
ncbi:MAG: ribosome maturation factor RimP [Gammaproteobacteria bacterium]|nr:MAG: ribosome maturation factor RimP [Gammaproteobacteria bacterium]